MIPRAIRLIPALVFLTCRVAPAQFTIQQAFPNLSFTNPVDLQQAGDGTDRLFVVEQRGVISVFENNPEVSEKSLFLDIQERVDDSGTEEGLLGLVFHPQYEANGYFYVNYTTANPNRNRVSRFRVTDSNPDVADPASELVLLDIDDPYSNHNAGQLAFGPTDSYLYVTTGDGGAGGDPFNNGQNLAALLGKILRIDVNRSDSGLPYAIPPDNPFANNTQGYREEIYAYGLRNPWRISFDPVTGWLWAADVGQDQWEEIDIILSGKNYGWRIMEGRHCYNPPEDCDTTGLTMPIWEYDHSQGISITGGYVYRGPSVPQLVGKYIYADWGSGRIWSLDYDGKSPPTNAPLLDTSLQISSFGVDRENELYICAFDGRIYRFTPATGIPGDRKITIPKVLKLGQNYPNPFNPNTTIPFEIAESSGNALPASLSIYDGRGRLVRTLFEYPLGPGSFRVMWDGRDERAAPVSSGVYFYSLRSGEEARARRMVVLE